MMELPLRLTRAAVSINGLPGFKKWDTQAKIVWKTPSRTV